MMKSVLVFTVSIFAVSFAVAIELPPDFRLPTSPGPFAVKSDEVSRTPFQSGNPIVATTYFYWYDIDTGTHFRNADGSDALTTHPATIDSMSWKNPDWHKRQFRQMVQAGIDVAMPVYWGSPTEQQPDGMIFSDEGLPKMVEALDAMLEKKEVAPTLAMFYDTSTISHNIGNYHVDLTTEAGKRWFYGTIRNFFSLVPPKHRATVDGKPIVFLYAAAFAKNVDDTLFPAVREMFRNNFGTDVYIVKTVEWPGKADSTYQWGAAINFQIHEAAAVGPGYDHSAVPGRTPLVRNRENGDFYTIGWERLLKRDPKTRPFLVHIETWNEFHEGTDICESKEYGTKYIESTRKFSDLFHAGKQIAEYSVKPKYPNPSAKPGNERGITAVDFAPPHGDGPIMIIGATGNGTSAKAWTTRPVPDAVEPNHRYFYFDIDSMCLLDPPNVAEVKVVYRLGPNANKNSFAIHYDSRDPNLTGTAQRFKEARPQWQAGSGDWTVATFRLADARFENGSNGSDFRLYVSGDELIVQEISVTFQ